MLSLLITNMKKTAGSIQYIIKKPSMQAPEEVFQRH